METAPRGPLQGSVLVVDDSLAQITATRERLVRAGYAPVFGAVDWTECRKALALFSPAVLVIDLQLPGMVSGDVMAAQLRRHPACHGSRFVFHSAMRRRDLEAIAARVGVDAWVEKGDLEALVATVSALAPPAATVGRPAPGGREAEGAIDADRGGGDGRRRPGGDATA